MRKADKDGREPFLDESVCDRYEDEKNSIHPEVPSVQFAECNEAIPSPLGREVEPLVEGELLSQFAGDVAINPPDNCYTLWHETPASVNQRQFLIASVASTHTKKLFFF